jgi:hypothetical protein
MTCRVARSFPNQTQIVEPIFCSECGLTQVEVLMASKTRGSYVCLNCVQPLIGLECTLDTQLPTASWMARPPTREKGGPQNHQLPLNSA